MACDYWLVFQGRSDREAPEGREPVLFDPFALSPRCLQRDPARRPTIPELLQPRRRVETGHGGRCERALSGWPCGTVDSKET